MTTLTVLDRLPPRHKGDPCCGSIEPPSLSSEKTEALADLLKTLADPTRLGILDLLAQQPEPICVCDLTPQFPQNQPTISHHLRLLRVAGLVETEKRGIWSYFWVTAQGKQVLRTITSLR